MKGSAPRVALKNWYKTTRKWLVPLVFREIDVYMYVASIVEKSSASIYWNSVSKIPFVRPKSLAKKCKQPVLAYTKKSF